MPAGNTPLSSKLPWELANPKWAASLNPILSLPMLSGNLISNILLSAGIPKTINHLLQRMQQGWILVDTTGSDVVKRTRPFNTTTLTLQSASDTTISLWVF